MNHSFSRRRLTRRDFFKLGGGVALAAAGASLLPLWQGRILSPQSLAEAASLAALTPNVFKRLIGSDGWISLPGDVSEGGVAVSPDPLAPSGRTTYVFGFRDVSVLPATVNNQPNPAILAQKNKVQNPAPLLFFDEGDKIQLSLANLGLALRPDLTDSHTVHWHGFRNALPAFDGVPEMSIAVPIGRDFPYFYHPTDPGTYMYHCHFEDVEHVQMGMTGVVFVRPAQNKTGAGGGPIARLGGNPGSPVQGYVYNDGVAPGNPLSTAYDREFSIFLNEMWAQSHYNDAHIQESDWSDFHADFYLMNGRSYPDTLAPNGGGTNSGTGDLIAPAGRPDLQHQPISSLIQCNAGDRVLLRFVNLGYTQPAMKLAGIPMHVVGKDATPLRGIGGGGLRNGADTSYTTDTIYIGAGESFDAIFIAPPHSGAGYDTYLLFNNAVGTLTRPGGAGLGGQMTEVRVYAGGTVPAQSTPNT